MLEVICKNCNKKFDKSLSQIKNTNNSNFCSRSCAAIFNNTKYPKRHQEGSCVRCSTSIAKSRTYCDQCFHATQSVDWSNITYGELSGRYKYQKNSRIRDLARTIYNKSGLLKECMVCGYDKHYHVCHKKSISSFTEDTLVSEINDLNNLAALCPNHHWELDHGHLTLP